MQTNPRYQNQFFFIILGLAFIIVFLIARPFVNSLLVALAFAVVLHPLFHKIQGWLKGRDLLATIFTLIIAFILILIPISLIVSRVFIESQNAYIAIGQNAFQAGDVIRKIEEPIQRLIPTFRLDIESYIRQTLELLVKNVGIILTTTFTTVVHTLILFIGLFFMIKNGDKMKERIISMSPLPDEYDALIIQRLGATINGVLRGSLFVSMIQGAVAGIGFAVFGLPSPTLWALLTAICALIPGVGTSLVVVPSVVFLFVSGNVFGAIGLAIWGAGFVGLVDNVIGPKLMSSQKGSTIHPFLILIAVLGGVTFFGPWGFILGPIAFSFLLSLLEVYRDCIIHDPTGGPCPLPVTIEEKARKRSWRDGGQKIEIRK